MEYEVGTYIDLRNLDNKIEVVAVVPKPNKVQQVASNLCAVGTQFIFNFSNDDVSAARKIPVAYA